MICIYKLYTVKLGYNDLGYNELLLIANKKLSLVGSGDFTHTIFLVITNRIPVITNRIPVITNKNRKKKFSNLQKTTFLQSECDQFCIA
jgi:hypothetical protein